MLRAEGRRESDKNSQGYEVLQNLVIRKLLLLCQLIGFVDVSYSLLGSLNDFISDANVIQGY
jgi:hypothetical protein